MRALACSQFCKTLHNLMNRDNSGEDTDSDRATA
jgi:hypothetical protein